MGGALHLHLHSSTKGAAVSAPVHVNSKREPRVLVPKPPRAQPDPLDPHKPIDDGWHPCPTCGESVRFRRYWDKSKGTHLSIALGHCKRCHKTEAGGLLKRWRDGTVLTRAMASFPPCDKCGQPKRSYGQHCKTCAALARRTPPPPAGVCRFASCDELIEPVMLKSGWKVYAYCDATCNAAEHKRLRRERIKAANGATPPKRRRKVWKRSERLAIAFAHGYVCHLCTELIDVSLHHNHKMALTIDHLTPVKAYGTDDDDNLKPAHRSCNSGKGANLPT